MIGTRSNRDAVGARVKVVSEKWAAFDQRKGGRSYQSAHDPRLHFGLGPRTKIDLIEIQWPSGLVETVKNLAADQAVTVKEGSGVVAAAYPRWSVKPRMIVGYWKAGMVECWNHEHQRVGEGA